MYLLEHDAKELLARLGVPVPLGRLYEADDTIHRAALSPPGPWMVKGQIAAGGRGNAGLVRRAATVSDVARHAAEIIGANIGGQSVNAIRIEQQIFGAEETYLAFLLDPASGGVRIVMSARGGVDIETVPPELMRTAVVRADAGALEEGVQRLAASLPSNESRAMSTAGSLLAKIFLEREALLIEINPLFAKPDGRWIAGDAKMVIDDNALERQPEIRALLQRRAAAYPAAACKMDHGFDYVVVDPGVEVGLLTTGAGLSMMLIDELRAQGIRPYNFLDIRTGGLRGETTRLVSVLRWIASGRKVRVVLVNIFAGITDLGEFAQLFLKALEQAPALKVPIVARLVGNGLPAAREVLGRAGIALHTDLDEAVAAVRDILAGTS
jgi:succinyl-CoA synthetase beta subunit